MIALWFLNDQYGCSSSCTLAIIDGQPQSTYFYSRPKSLSSRVAILISLAVMHSSTSLHDSITFMVMCIPGISSSLSDGCLWITRLLWRVVAQLCLVFYYSLSALIRLLSWMLLAIWLHCQVLHSLGTTCHPSIAKYFPLDQHLMHLFLSLVVLSCFRIPSLCIYEDFGSAI